MKYLVIAAAAIVAVSGMLLKEDMDNVYITKDTMTTMDIKTKQVLIMKLLNHILEPTIYKDIKECSLDFDFNMYMDKFIRTDVVRTFLDTYKMGMLPRGEIFVHTNDKHMMEAIKVFHVMYFAKDFDTFIRCCCWMREHLNEGMFVYALTVAVLHRDDCRGIVLPAPYEIYPFYFVNSDVIHKAFMMKMKRGMIDRVLLDYYRIHVTDKNVCVIDSRKDVRHTLTVDDRLTYFTEDIDLNTYYYYFHMDYPVWMVDDVFMINKERRGEVMMYGMMQLLARYRLERLSHGMCDIKPFMWDKTMKTGYWPKIRMHNGLEMPMRNNYVKLVHEDNIMLKRMVDDFEMAMRTVSLTGVYMRRDGTVFKIEKSEDIEILCRLILTDMGIITDNKTINLMTLMKKMFSYNLYNMDKYTYVPTTMDIFQTNLRDPVYWKLMKRITEIVKLFKNGLMKYTREELDFPGVKIDNIIVDKLVTYMDSYDMDITNALYLDTTEMKSMKSDMLFVARQRRLNHMPFKMTIDVVSDKTIESVVRVFLGPKYDCMGRLMDLNDKRLDMVEIDSFIYKLESGKNTIVRDSMDMHNLVGDKMWMRKMWDSTMMMDDMTMMDNTVTKDNMWYRYRMGFPKRLLLPMGNRMGLEMQLYVIITPVHKDMLMKTLDMEVMKIRKTCRFTTCMDTLPLGFPFDRHIDYTKFFTKNMKFVDVMIYHKDMDTVNMSKKVDFTDLITKRDDLTYMDKDMLVERRYVDRKVMVDDKMDL